MRHLCGTPKVYSYICEYTFQLHYFIPKEKHICIGAFLSSDSIPLVELVSHKLSKESSNRLHAIFIQLNAADRLKHRIGLLLRAHSSFKEPLSRVASDVNESSESNNSSSQQQSLGLPPIVQSGESGVEERSLLLGYQ